MRQKCAAIDLAVETIVEAHHEDFYESYKTFTVILDQFAKAKEYLAALRRHLMLAQSQVRPDTARLRALYHQDLMLKDMQRLLRDALSVSSLPERIDTLMKKNNWSQATSLLVQGCNVLARDEMVKVQGLWHLRDELANRRTKLLEILTSQLERHVYERSKVDLHPNMSVGRLPGRSVPRPTRPLHRQGSDLLAAAASTPLGGNETLQTPLFSKHKRSATYAGPGERIFLNPAPTPPAGHLHFPSRQEGLGELHGDTEDVVVAADCIAQLGGIALVLVSLRSQMPARVRKVILDTVILSSRLSSAGARPPRSGIDDETLGILELRASSAAVYTVEAVFKQCVNTLHALVMTLEQLAATKSPAPSAGMNMLLSNDAAQLGCSVKDLLPPSEDDDGIGNWAGVESSKAWECLQIECRKFLSLVLDVSADALDTHGQYDTFGAKNQINSGVEHVQTHGTSHSSRWWWSFGGRGLDDTITKPSNSVTFSFVAEEEARKEALKPQPLQTLASFSPQANRNEGTEETQVKGTGLVSLALKTSYDHELADCVARAIGWQHGTKSTVESATDTDARLVALVAAIYKPTTKFVDAAQKILPRSAGTQGSKNAVLKPYLDDVVRSHFLPAVFLSARAWSRRILDAGDALKPRNRSRGAGWTVKSNLTSPQKAGSAQNSSLPTALPLPAAVGTAALTNRLLSLAASVPPFVTHLAGVLENVLDQVLLVFQASISTEWDGCIALMLADNVRILHILAQEKAATALGGPAAFYVKQGDIAGQAMGNAAVLMDSFLSSAIAAGFGSSTKPLDRELLEAIQEATQEAAQVQKAAKASRPSAGRYVQLASLAEAADHIADVVSTAASAAAFQFQREKQEENQYKETPRRGGEAWRRRHLSHAPQFTASDLTGGLAESLVRAADRFRGFAGRCIRTLRLDLAVLTVSQLSLLEDLCWGGASTDSSVTSRDVEERVVRDLGQVVMQLDEETKYYLPPERRAYVFGSVAPFAMQTAVSLLPRFVERGIKFDTRCISRICRALSSLQPSLCSVGSFMGTNLVANGQANYESILKRQIEKAKLYYSLLLQPPEELIAAAMAKPHRFSISEYEALLNATVLGRSVTAEHKARLRLALRQSLGDVEGSNM